jgi:hypothetical protein
VRDAFRPCRIIFAPRSAIIITGAAALPDLVVSMIDALTTRRR